MARAPAYGSSRSSRMSSATQRAYARASSTVNSTVRLQPLRLAIEQVHDLQQRLLPGSRRRGRSRPGTRPVRRARGRVLVAVQLAPSLLLVGCGVSRQPPPADPSGELATCKAAYRHWVDQAESLNAAGADIGELLVAQEAVQRRVFELCTLAEAEQHNREMLLSVAPGIVEPLIQPDVRTFAEIECVDEGPLLEGTALCAEVGVDDQP